MYCRGNCQTLNKGSTVTTIQVNPWQIPCLTPPYLPLHAPLCPKFRHKVPKQKSLKSPNSKNSAFFLPLSLPFQPSVFISPFFSPRFTMWYYHLPVPTLTTKTPLKPPSNPSNSQPSAVYLVLGLPSSVFCLLSSAAAASGVESYKSADSQNANAKKA